MDLVLETFRSLRAHAGRFVLTSLGVAWGAFMLTFLSAQMGGLSHHFRSELEEIGPKLIFMGAGVVMKNRVGERGARAVELENEDVAQLGALAAVENVSPNIERWNEIVRAGKRTKLLNVMGWDEDAPVIRSLTPAEGRFFAAHEVAAAARVAVLGPRAKQRLFGAAPALGETIHVAGHAFRVIGVATPKGEQLINNGNEEDLMVVIPYTAAQRWLTQSDLVPELFVTAPRREDGGRAIHAVRELLGQRVGFGPAQQETAIWAEDFWDTLKVLFGMFTALQLFLVAAGLVTLFVGAVGVMNIMLVVVGERTWEIGLRKALGATNRDVFVQFFAEAFVVGVASGLVGTGAGLLFVRLSAGPMRAAGMNVTGSPDALTTSAIALSLALVAVVAGVLPALRAARIPPSEALRAY